METSDEKLRATALASYERGRLRDALLRALPIVALTLVSLSGSIEPLVTLAIAGSTIVMFTLLDKRGGPFGSGSRLGLVSGLIPFGVSIVSRPLPHIEALGLCVHGCVIMCAASSIGTMAALVYIVHRRHEGPASWLSATWTAVSIGAIACSCVGVAGVGLLFLSMVMASPLVLVIRPLRQT